MLDPQFKVEWCAALRSGEYRQNRGAIHNEDCTAFCCIGVAALLRGMPLGRALDGGLKTTTYEVSIPKRSELVALNDGGASFAEIATWIEENL